MLLTYPLMVAIQEISARIGRTTGHGISGNLCRHYPSWLLHLIITLLYIANTINIGADLSSMADAARFCSEAKVSFTFRSQYRSELTNALSNLSALRQ
jgi:Mn2+/Fe2+ NRAMP family transporter